MLRRTSHAVYDCKYHLVWAPKYRKWILRADLRERTQELFQEIGENHDFFIQESEVQEDHVHLFLEFPPRYSLAQVVDMFKSISASVLFREFPEVARELWGGEFWQAGYFARTVGDEVTAEMVRRYLRDQSLDRNPPDQLSLF